jgi:hypothetical protein
MSCSFPEDTAWPEWVDGVQQAQQGRVSKRIFLARSEQSEFPPVIGSDATANQTHSSIVEYRSGAISGVEGWKAQKKGRKKGVKIGVKKAQSLVDPH